MTILLELLTILALALLNGLFSLSEMAIVSASPTRLQGRAAQGDRGAEAAMALAEAPSQFLSTIQVGITAIGILVGAVSGATLAEQLAAALSILPGLQPYAASLGFAGVFLLTTYIFLVLGELTPKQLALQHAEAIACLVARPMAFLARVFAPLVTGLTWSAETVLALFGVQSGPPAALTEEELSILLQRSVAEGALEPEESHAAQRVLTLDDISLGQVMTPAPEIEWLSVQASPEEIRRLIARSQHSHYPVRGSEPDEILGVLRASALLVHCLAHPTQTELPIRSLLQPVGFLPVDATPAQAIAYFRTSPINFCLVVDEFGNLQGLLTPTDILEAIVGDLPSQRDAHEEPEIVRREDGSWLVAGSLVIEDAAALLNVDRSAFRGTEYDTMGGFIMAELGRIPRIGDVLHWQGYRFEVVDMDRRRVDRILIAPTGEPSTPAGTASPEEREG